MADTNFIAKQTVVTADWLNDVNDLRYGAGDSARGSALLQYMQAGTGAAVNEMQSVIRREIYVMDYYRPSDGDTLQTALEKAITYVTSLGGGQINLGTIQIDLAAQTVWTLSNITFKGQGKYLSRIKLIGTNASDLLYLKSPTNVQFINIGFEASQSATILHGLWCTNVTKLEFYGCRFSGFGAPSGTKAGSCCVTIQAVDVSTTVVAAGNSTEVLFQNCIFEGDSRRTNFAIRAVTDWDSPPTATLDNVRVYDSLFNGFNWNAVEFAGPKTFACAAISNQANLCGLTPIDIDKGAHNCIIMGLVINRLLGNADSATASPTRISAINIQGADSNGPFAYNNLVTGIQVQLLASDIAAFNGANAQGAVLWNIAFARRCKISNINAYIDSVPVRVRSMSLAQGILTYASGCDIRDIMTTNWAEGILVDVTDFTALGAEWNTYENCRNNGTMTGEALVVRMFDQISRNNFQNIQFYSAMSTPYVTSNDALIYISGTATGFATGIKNFYVGSPTAGIKGIQQNGYRLSIHEGDIDIDTQANVFAPSPTGTQLFLGSNDWSGIPIDLIAAEVNFGSLIVYQNWFGTYLGGNPGSGADPGVSWSSSAQPSNTVTYAQASVARNNGNTTPVATGGSIGWVRTASTGWKPYGTIS